MHCVALGSFLLEGRRTDESPDPSLQAALRGVPSTATGLPASALPPPHVGLEAQQAVTFCSLLHPRPLLSERPESSWSRRPLQGP